MTFGETMGGRREGNDISQAFAFGGGRRFPKNNNLILLRESFFYRTLNIATLHAISVFYRSDSVTLKVRRNPPIQRFNCE